MSDHQWIITDERFVKEANVLAGNDNILENIPAARCPDSDQEWENDVTGLLTLY